MTAPKNLAQRVLVSLAAVVAALALLAARPWSSRNAFRQMRLFTPGTRIQNFREMDRIFRREWSIAAMHRIGSRRRRGPHLRRSRTAERA